MKQNTNTRTLSTHYNTFEMRSKNKNRKKTNNLTILKTLDALSDNES